MSKNKKLINKIKKIWKQQEEELIKNHKEIYKIIKDFSYEDLKGILEEEEQQLYLMGNNVYQEKE